ncbi:MAG: hypothetical protein HQK83_02885 [Fibrobacteria bacterium]|nr:hypothetical protein [Fibrobacteria bacterium]
MNVHVKGQIADHIVQAIDSITFNKDESVSDLTMQVHVGEFTRGYKSGDVDSIVFLSREDAPPIYLYVNVNVSDYVRPDKLNQVLGSLMEHFFARGIKLSFSFTDMVLKELVEAYPELIDSMNTSPLVSINYHLREPHPCEFGQRILDKNGKCTPFSQLDSDYVMDEIEKFERYPITNLETFRFFDTTSCPVYDSSQTGGFSYVSDVFKRKPIFVGSNSEGLARQAHLEAIRRLGGIGYVSYHVGEADKENPFSTTNALLDRPSDAGVVFEVGKDNVKFLKSQISAKIDYSRPLYVVVLVHGYNFYLETGERWQLPNARLLSVEKQREFMSGFLGLVDVLAGDKDMQIINTDDIVEHAKRDGKK